MTKTVRIFLLQDAPNVGQKNDVKSVAFGFAKNWLIPQKLAALVTPGIIARMEKEKALKTSTEEREQKTSSALAEKISSLTISIKPRKTAKGTLYAAISAKKIADLLKKEGIAIEESFISLETPIKKAGEYEIPIVFSEILKVKLKVIIQ